MASFKRGRSQSAEIIESRLQSWDVWVDQTDVASVGRRASRMCRIIKRVPTFSHWETTLPGVETKPRIRSENPRLGRETSILWRTRRFSLTDWNLRLFVIHLSPSLSFIPISWNASRLLSGLSASINYSNSKGFTSATFRFSFTWRNYFIPTITPISSTSLLIFAFVGIDRASWICRHEVGLTLKWFGRFSLTKWPYIKG